MAPRAPEFKGAVFVHSGLIGRGEHLGVAREAERLGVLHEELGVGGGVGLVTDDAGAHGDGAVDELELGEVLGVAAQAELALRIGDEHAPLIGAVRVVATEALAVGDGLVHGRGAGELVALLAQLLLGHHEVELVLFGVALDVAGVAGLLRRAVHDLVARDLLVTFGGAGLGATAGRGRGRVVGGFLAEGASHKREVQPDRNPTGEARGVRLRGVSCWAHDMGLCRRCATVGRGGTR